MADVRRHGPSLTGDRRRIRRENLDQHRLGGRGREGRLPGEHLVQHTTERVDIRPWVHITVTRGLFGAHVVGCAQAEAGLRDAPSARLGHGQRDAEVCNERFAPLTQEDVARLDVAVHDAVFVRVVECVSDFLRDRHSAIHTELLLAVDALPE